ncbi:hypothetical protein [Larkinella sp. GY13]
MKFIVLIAMLIYMMSAFRQLEKKLRPTVLAPSSPESKKLKRPGC